MHQIFLRGVMMKIHQFVHKYQNLQSYKDHKFAIDGKIALRNFKEF